MDQCCQACVHSAPLTNVLVVRKYRRCIYSDIPLVCNTGHNSAKVPRHQCQFIESVEIHRKL